MKKIFFSRLHVSCPGDALTRMVLCTWLVEFFCSFLFIDVILKYMPEEYAMPHPFLSFNFPPAPLIWFHVRYM